MSEILKALIVFDEVCFCYLSVLFHKETLKRKIGMFLGDFLIIGKILYFNDN